MTGNSALQRVLRYIVLGGIFLLPFVCLLVAESLFFPYITGKNFAFRIIVEILTGAWLALAIVDPAYRPKRSIILGALAFFVAIIGIADVLGENPFKSIWSNFERMDGWITLIHVLAYTVVAASALQSEHIWKRLFQTSIAVSVYVALYGFLQLAGISALGQGGAAGLSARVDATFGNPIYLAVYLLFHIFLAAHLWIQSWNERTAGERLAPSLAYGATIVLNTLVLFFTGTRGTILGLAGGICLALVLYAWGSGSRRLRVVAVAFILCVVLGGIGLRLGRDTSFVQSIGVLHRLATISTEDNTVKARFINWSIAWKGVKENPILGWGQENYALVFDKYYDPRMYAQEPWFDRVHNVFFDWLVAGGIAGLAAYLAVFALTLRVLWRGAFSIAERSLFTGLLAAYFCHNFFVFDNVTSYILFGTVLAYIAYRSGRPPLWNGTRISMRFLPVAALLAAALVWASAWYVNSHALSANRSLLRALSMQQDPLATLEEYKTAIAFKTIGTQEAREQLAQTASALAGIDGIATSTKLAFFETASNEMLEQAREVPLDARFPLFLGILHDAYGDYGNGATAFRRALELSPNKQSILYELGRNAMIRGENNESIGYFKKALELAPENVEARLLYAAALIHAGNSALASEVLSVLPKGAAADPRILAAYAGKKEFAKAALLWEERVTAVPSDIQAYFTLAALYYEMGDRTRAVQALERAKQAHPEVAEQADSLIQEIRSGTAHVL